ncbi:MAG: hypothetical protein IT210_09665, partial [Armatimonadetes bacterium]|nr:hypothetical protein [Armatimonadota bacterium]
MDAAIAHIGVGRLIDVPEHDARQPGAVDIQPFQNEAHRIAADRDAVLGGIADLQPGQGDEA